MERLKRDKKVLMQELAELRQRQQTTDALLQAITAHAQDMEQRQHKIMSFLSKAIQSPRLLAQLVHRKRSNNGIPCSNKNQRLSNQRDFEREIAQLGNFYLPIDDLDTTRISSIGSSLDTPLTVSEVYSSLNMANEGKTILSVAPEQIPQAVTGFQASAQTDECIADILRRSYLTFEAESTLVIPSSGIELENFSSNPENDLSMLGEDIKLSGVHSFWDSPNPLSGDNQIPKSKCDEDITNKSDSFY